MLQGSPLFSQNDPRVIFILRSRRSSRLLLPLYLLRLCTIHSRQQNIPQHLSSRLPQDIPSQPTFLTPLLLRRPLSSLFRQH